MALTIKMLKDENKQDFIPFTNTNSVVNSENVKLQTILDSKLEKQNIKAGEGISLDTQGNDITISCTAEGGSGDSYVLPIASNETLGGIKIGNGLSIDTDGVVTVIESDGSFTESPAATITQDDIDNWNSKPDNPGITSESDPIFTTSPAYKITQNDIDIWNSKPSKDEVSSEIGGAIDGAGYLVEETDPLFKKSPAYTITTGDIASWNSKADVTGILVENDPIFKASPAYTITEENKTEWSNKLDEEIDPLFVTSPAYTITEEQKTSWNNKLDTETDPVFTASPAFSITNEKIEYWNNKADGLVEEGDPVFTGSPAYGITDSDITNWNNKIGLDEAPDPDYDHSYFFFTNNGNGSISGLTSETVTKNIIDCFGQSGPKRFFKGRFQYESYDTAFCSYLYPDNYVPRLKIVFKCSASQYIRIFPKIFYYDSEGNRVEVDDHTYETNLGLPSKTGTFVTTTSGDAGFVESGFWYEQVFYIRPNNLIKGKKLYLDCNFGIRTLMKGTTTSVENFTVTIDAI